MMADRPRTAAVQGIPGAAAAIRTADIYTCREVIRIIEGIERHRKGDDLDEYYWAELLKDCAESDVLEATWDHYRHHARALWPADILDWVAVREGARMESGRHKCDHRRTEAAAAGRSIEWVRSRDSPGAEGDSGRLRDVHSGAHMNPVVVLVPDERGVQAFAESDLVRAVVYDIDGRMADQAADAEVLVAHGLDPARAGEVFARLPKLRMVQLFSSGSDHWAAVVPDGVRLSNADRAHGGTVAEWVVAQLLTHYRDLLAYRDRQQEMRWEARPTGTMAGKRVLVFGAGDIGENVRCRLEPFGTAVTLVGRTARDDILDVPQALARLGEFDVVVLALPLDVSTTGMVDAGFLAAMRDGAALVNVGRGPLVDTNALLAELRARRLHAFLDVTDPEPLPPEHPLWTARGAVITPHVAGITEGTRDRCWAAVVRKVTEYAHERSAEMNVSGHSDSTGR